MFSLVRPLLFRLDPEQAHGLAITALASGLHPRARPDISRRLASTVAGIDFPNPLGLAAGFDKDAEVPDAVLSLGFGFCEVGSVTPRPQEGNLKPRLFRLEQHGAVINRMGFNNRGHAAALDRLKSRKGRGIVGVNIGANKDSRDRVADYVSGLETFYDVARYFTVNISSPNTPGLRGLQDGEELETLLARLNEKRDELAATRTGIKPMFLKVAPDLTRKLIEHVAACAPGRVEGLVISNTTLSRDDLGGEHAQEAGGLSGKPLFDLSTRVLARFYQATGGGLPLVGVGGVASAEDAFEKIRAGASLVQLYTAMVFEGPRLPSRIVRGLDRCLDEAGYGHISDAVGTGVDRWL